MTQTIEQLTARVRELETQLAANNPLLDEAANRLDELEQQLAASQAYAEQLREAFGSLIECRENLSHLDKPTEFAISQARNFVISDMRCIARKALALPRDTSALDAYVEQKVKEVQRNASGFAELYLERGERIHHLTRQRDLAVEALERQLADAKHCQQVMCNEVGIGFLDVVTLSNSESVLSAIKESEGK